MDNRGHLGILVLAGFVSLTAVGIAFATTQSKGGEPSAVQVVPESSHPLVSSEAGDDSDGDGLPSWKEVLLGTDPANADSDGDGTLDGIEVAQRANPLIEGTEPMSEDAYVAPRALPSTEALARELFATYAKARSDGTFDAGEVEEGINEVIMRNVTPPTPIERYALTDLSLEADVAPEAYENAVMAAFRSATHVREYELNVFARAVSENSSVELKKLAETALVYERVRDALLTVDVPERAGAEHLLLVNEITFLAASVRGLSTWTGDPLDALALLNEFSKREERYTRAVSEFQSMIAYLKKIHS